MVKKTDGKGGVWHEPPYTEEEQMALYKSLDTDHWTIYRVKNPNAPAPAAEEQPLSQEQPPPRETEK